MESGVIREVTRCATKTSQRQEAQTVRVREHDD
jgi:hypothetical protein